MAESEIPVSVRRLIIEVDPSTLNVTEFCRTHGVSTWFFYDLRRRHRVLGDKVLEPGSRAPRVVANKTPAGVEDAIVAKRKELADAGLDAGPGSIAFHLRDLPGLPSESTIWRILSQRGFIVAEPAKAPKSKGRRFVASRANERWQLDDTSWELADGTPVKIFNVLDDHSRLLVASSATESMTGAFALLVLATAAAVLGWPATILSDNAKAFRDVLAAALGNIGVRAVHSRPYHPQTNGKVERFHQTLKKWLAKQPPAATLDELQAQLDLFRHIYNHQRPHRGIERQFPARVWEHAPKDAPATRALGATTTTHTSQVRGGYISAGRYDIALGATHNNATTLTIITGTAAHVFIEGRLTRQLTLNPTQRTQPLHNRRGRPPRLP